MRIATLVIAALIATGQAGCSSTGAVRNVDLLIVGGTVIDPASRTVGWNSGIAIDDGLIVALHAGAGDFASRNTINAGDRFIVPAFVDVRVHWETDGIAESSDPAETEVERSRYYGVTRSFDLVPLRAATAVRTPGDVREEIAMLAGAGADVIGIVSGISPAALGAAVQAAQDAGLPVAVRGDAAPLATAVNSPVDPSLYRRMGDDRIYYIALQNTMDGRVNGVSDSDRLADPFLRETLTAGEAALLQQNYALPSDESQSTGLESPFDYAREARDAGAILLTGTGAGSPHTFPGYSIHEELWMLADAGIEPIDVLAAATSNAAVFLGKQNNWGSIEAGHAADLLLLKGNPLADIRNTRRISEVIQGGRVVDRAALLDR